MVLAGVDYLLPIYRETNSYPNLLEEGIEGNPEELNTKKLHQRAWKLVEPIFDEARQKAGKQFELLYNKKNDLATDDLKTVVKASAYGCVDTLFVPLRIQFWGRFEPDRNQVVIDQEPNLENKDLLDYAAMQTILNSGQVFAVQPDELPGSGDLAAILRYSIS